MLTLEDKKEARRLFQDVSAAATEALYRPDAQHEIRLLGKCGDIKVHIIIEKQERD